MELAGKHILTHHMRAVGQKVWICFIAVEGPIPHWKHSLDFTSYEKLQGWLAATQRRGARRHVIEAELPPP